MIHLKKAALLAMAGLGLVSSSASAATTGAAAGDLFLGFRQTGNTSDYLVNLGQVFNYRDATSSFSLSIGNIGADLTSLFGAGWNTDATVSWGLVATSGSSSLAGGLITDPANVIYASKPESVFGTAETGFNRATASAQSGVRSDILTLGATYAGNSSTTNSPVGLIQSSSVSTSWAGFNPGGTSFSFYTGLEGTFAGGAATAALDLFRMQATNTAGLPGSYEGTFTISNAGAVSYSAVPVPEPSALMMLGLGSSLLGLVRMRRNQPVLA